VRFAQSDVLRRVSVRNFQPADGFMAQSQIAQAVSPGFVARCSVPSPATGCASVMQAPHAAGLLAPAPPQHLRWGCAPQLLYSADLPL